MGTPTAFIPGIELCRRFHEEVVRPLLLARFPEIAYSACLAGGGSELLGLDTEMSVDHDWGPRLTLFLPDESFHRAPEIAKAIATEMPESFLGHATRFADRRRPIPADLAAGAYGTEDHGVEFYRLDAFTSRFLGLPPGAAMDAKTWLGTPQQLLLAFTSGAVFHDSYGEVTALRKRLAFYPEDIKRYLMACYWTRIAEEQSFVGRCGAVGDEAGSAIIAARLIRDVMRIGFLLDGKYAPYSKWLGTAFSRLDLAANFRGPIHRVLSAPEWRQREAALCDCYCALEQANTEAALPTPALRIASFHGRPYQVCNADEFARALRNSIADPVIAALPLHGSIDVISDNTVTLNSLAAGRAVLEALLSGSEIDGSKCAIS